MWNVYFGASNQTAYNYSHFSLPMAAWEWSETSVFTGCQMRENKVVRVKQIIDETDDFVSGHNLHEHKYRW